MAKDTSDAFCMVLEAQYLQPGMLIVSWADDLKSEWTVLSVACRVEDRWTRVEMQHKGRVVVSHTQRDEGVLRKVYRGQTMAGWDAPRKES